MQYTRTDEGKRETRDVAGVSKGRLDFITCIFILMKVFDLIGDGGVGHVELLVGDMRNEEGPHLVQVILDLGQVTICQNLSNAMQRPRCEGGTACCE